MVSEHEVIWTVVILGAYACLALPVVLVYVVVCHAVKSFLRHRREIREANAILTARLRPSSGGEAHTFEFDGVAPETKGLSLRFYKGSQFVLVSKACDFSSYALRVHDEHPLVVKFDCVIDGRTLKVTADADEVRSGDIQWSFSGTDVGGCAFNIRAVTSKLNKSTCALQQTIPTE